MFYTTEVRGKALNTFAKERVIFGKCERGARFYSPAVGRLIPCKSIKGFTGKEALLAVIQNIHDIAEIGLFDDPRIVGAVFISEKAANIPFPSICVQELPDEYGGRIALLDPERERLFVSPDISTLNRYLPRFFQRSGDPLPTFVLREGKRLSLSVICDIDGNHREGNMLLPIPKAEDQEELYLHCAEIAEGAAGRQVTFSLFADEASVSSVGALMRSAVWGELSILLCGILTKNEFTELMQKFCHAFCELEADRREFDGYVPRGLCIDSPYLLSVAEELFGVDFFVIDAENLLSLFCNGRKAPPEDIHTHILKLISSLISKRRDISYGAILGEKTVTPSFCRALSDMGIEKYITTPDLYLPLYRCLRTSCEQNKISPRQGDSY